VIGARKHCAARLLIPACLLFALAGCGTLQDKSAEEQQIVLCAQRALAATPGITNVKVLLPFSAFRTVIRYDYIDRLGRSARAQVVIGRHAPPSGNAFYTYNVNDGSIPDDRNVRELLGNCGLGIAVMKGERTGRIILD
jgi:hypothetical protein